MLSHVSSTRPKKGLTGLHIYVNPSEFDTRSRLDCSNGKSVTMNGAVAVDIYF